VIRVLLVAASAVARAGLEALLGRSPLLTIVGAVGRGDALADAIESLEPDVVLMAADGGAAGPPSPTALAQLRLSPDASSRAPAVVVLADSPTPEWSAEVLRAGVRGLLPEDATADEIYAAVEAAAAGLVSFPAELTGSLLGLPSRAPASRAAGTTLAQPLSPREHEVLGMLAEGLGNKQIAGRLGISEHTVKTHVASILAKLDAYTRAEAVAIGARLGMILL
jgi:DNA-binding NarL/FixJ family response regulator